MTNVKWFILVIISEISLYVAAAEDDPTLVTLPDGQIKGHTVQSPDKNVYYAFQEIPYAAPPVGNLRFQPPAPPEKWDGVLTTTSNKKICYQSGDIVIDIFLTQTEDCLYLNVYTPVTPGNSSQTPLPVLIWIHGGSYTSGAGVRLFYNPGYFIDHNVVVVTINYRLGPLGFLTTEDGVIPGNLGLKDQHFAIQWVKKNINLFGGDPDKVTISGQSAGAGSVGLHLISKQSKGLFRAGILQSGTALSVWSHQEFARFYAFELGRSLNSNFTSDDSEELLKLLLSLPASDINENTVTPDIGKEAELEEGGGLIWLPVIEDESLDGAFVTGPFHEDIKTGNINHIPILIGFASEEQTFFWKNDSPKPATQAEYLEKDLSHLIGNKFNMTKQNKLTAGSKLKDVYTDKSFEDDLAAVVKFYSDESFTTPAIRHAKLQSNYTDVYLYQFSYKGKMGGHINDEMAGVKGVGHGEDLAYLWNARFPPLTPDEPEDITTRHRLLTLWTNFVKFLNPTPEEDDFLGNVVWEKVAPNNLVYLNINTTLEMQTNPRHYLEWEKIIDVYAIPPLIGY
ncbi:hypothetical protein NQ315_001959 [Exocentrus adspersus]|uniref:Carboxylic ester hydrolase n=1 Tax=Exocentrus adspersus TaxID=1586481 RepID=A0AAV8WA13_9CUCU|nr:hypothetical protein NQ315_001959 [Exocentrus adspersus]